jgi:hypothetical protein
LSVLSEFRLDRIERWYALVTEKCNLRGTHRSAKELNKVSSTSNEVSRRARSAHA